MLNTKEMLFRQNEAVRQGIPFTNYGLLIAHINGILERSIAENIFCGRYPLKGFGPLKIVDHDRMYEETAVHLKEVGLDFDPRTKLSELFCGTAGLWRKQERTCRSDIRRIADLFAISRAAGSASDRGSSEFCAKPVHGTFCQTWQDLRSEPKT